MQKFETDEQQLETCMSIFNPLEVSIDVNHDVKVENIVSSTIDGTLYNRKAIEINASLTYPNFAIAPKNRTIVFEVYLVDSADFIVSTSMSGTPSTNKISFTYKLPIKKTIIDNKGGNGNTILSVIDTDLITNSYAKVISHLQNEINKYVYDEKWMKKPEDIAKNLKSAKLYALAYVVIDGADDTQTIRPDIAMKKFELESDIKSDYDDLMLESVKSKIDDSLKEKIYFSKEFLEIKDLKVEDLVKGKSINASCVPREEKGFFVKVE